MCISATVLLVGVATWGLVKIINLCYLMRTTTTTLKLLKKLSDKMIQIYEHKEQEP